MTINGVVMNVSTNGVAPNSGPAVKTFVDANIQMTPRDGDQPGRHEPRADVSHQRQRRLGRLRERAGGHDCTVSITNGPGLRSSAEQCTTVGATGRCTVTITSATAGNDDDPCDDDGHGRRRVADAATGDAHAGDSPNANKNWVNARISIAPNATNEVGAAAHVHGDVAEGHGRRLRGRPAGETVQRHADERQRCVADAGRAVQPVHHERVRSVPGDVHLADWRHGHRSRVVDADDRRVVDHRQTNGVAPNSGDAVKTFVDANIQITPATATNPVGTNHTLHCHINVNDGSGGFVNAPAGTVCTVSIISRAGHAGHAELQHGRHDGHV